MPYQSVGILAKPVNAATSWNMPLRPEQNLQDGLTQPDQMDLPSGFDRLRMLQAILRQRQRILNKSMSFSQNGTNIRGLNWWAHPAYAKPLTAAVSHRNQAMATLILEAQ